MSERNQRILEVGTRGLTEIGVAGVPHCHKRGQRGERGVAWHAPPYSLQSMTAVSVVWSF